MVDRRPATRFSLLALVLQVSSSSCHAASDHHPWSPIVLGRPVVPPVIPAAVLQHATTAGGGGQILPVGQLEEKNDEAASAASGPTRPPVRRYRRRQWRPVRRRRPYMGYIPYNQYRRSYNYVPLPPSGTGAAAAAAPAAGFRSSGYRQARGSPRVMVEEERGLMADLRSLFGAPEHCLEGSVQYSCTLAPVCWLTGGVVTEGIQRTRIFATKVSDVYFNNRN